MFVDLKRGDFRLSPDSPALAMGIRNIDMSQIGLTEQYPPAYEKIVRDELGTTYDSFENLEAVCNTSSED